MVVVATDDGGARGQDAQDPDSKLLGRRKLALLITDVTRLHKVGFTFGFNSFSFKATFFHQEISFSFSVSRILAVLSKPQVSPGWSSFTFCFKYQ